MIKISGLSFKYKKKPIFNNYNLVIEDKGLVLLNEKSGFGKTTLVRLINKELKPDKGSITSTFNSTSYLPQDFNLIEDKSVYENISLTGKYSDELLKYFDLEDYKNELVSSLSLGQRQIVAFIRCYIQNAEFYIFDEPTQNMDVNNTKKAMHLINGLAENHAVLLITHEEIDEDKEEVEINPVDVKRNSIETTNNKRRLFAMSLFMLIGILIGIIFPASTSYVPYVPTFPIAEENLYSIPFGREDIINSNEHDDFLLEIAEKTEIIMPRRITFSYITNVDSDSISTTPLAIGKSLVYNKTSNLKGNYDYEFEDDKFYLTKNLAKYIMKDTKIPFSEFENFVLEAAISLSFGGYLNDAEGDYIFINDYLYYSGIQETRSFGMRTKFIEYNPKYYTVIEGTGVLENSDDALYTSFSSESSDPSIGEITKDGLRCVGIIQTNSEYFDRSSYYRDSQVGGWNFCFCEKDKAIILGLKELIYSRISLFISTDEDTANSLNLVNVDSEELDTYIYFGDDDNSSVIYRVHGTMNDYFSQNIVIVSTLGLLSLALLFIVDFIFYYDKKDIKALKESGVSLRSSLKGNFISTAIKSSLLILFMGICSCLIIAFNITISTLVVHVFLLSLLATISIIAINLVIQLFVFILRYRSNFKRGINL